MAAIVPKEMYTHGSKDFNYAYYPHSQFGTYAYFFDAHWHEEWEIILVKDGSFRFYVDGQLFTVRKNQALFIDQYAIHAISGYEPGNGLGYSCFVFGLRFLCPDSESYINRHFFSRIDSAALTQQITGQKEYEQELLRHLWVLERCSAEPKRNALKIQITLLSVFDILLREQVYDLKPHLFTAQNELIKTALLHINRGYQDTLQVHDLADSLNLSTDHFIRLFKSKMGITPKQYIQNLRMQKAVSLMNHEPGLPVSEIAQRLGFDDVNYFSRCFKRMLGKSPSEYIRDLNGEMKEK